MLVQPGRLSLRLRGVLGRLRSEWYRLYQSLAKQQNHELFTVCAIYFLEHLKVKSVSNHCLQQLTFHDMYAQSGIFLSSHTSGRRLVRDNESHESRVSVAVAEVMLFVTVMNPAHTSFLAPVGLL